MLVILAFFIGFLPMGVLLGFNFVYLFTFLSVLSLMVKFFLLGGKIRIKVVFLFLILLLFLLFNLKYSIAENDFEYIRNQFNLMVFFFLMMTVFLIEPTNSNGLIGKSIVFGYISLTILKLFFIMLMAFSFISIVEFQNLNLKLFGYIPVMQIITGSFVRVQYITDILVIPVMYCYLNNKILKLHNTTNRLLIGIILFCGLIFTFSRYLFLAVFIIIFLYLLFKIKKIKYHHVLVFSIILFCFVFSFYEVIFDFINTRFFSEANNLSDNIRNTQITKIINEIILYPLTGHGIGYYINDYIRSSSTPYSYEAQWLALTMQLGLIGSIYLGFYFLALSFDFSFKKSHKKINVLCILILVLFASFTNPLLFSLGSVGSLLILRELNYE